MVWFNRVLLTLGAVTGIGLALTILFLPVPFYSGYGITPNGNVSLLNELKAPTLVILVLGLLQAQAILQPNRLAAGLGSGLLLYLGFGLSRLVAMSADGLPSTGLVAVALTEVLLGLGFAVAFWRQRRG
jgi:hypothetical protein